MSRSSVLNAGCSQETVKRQHSCISMADGTDHVEEDKLIYPLTFQCQPTVTARMTADKAASIVL